MNDVARMFGIPSSGVKEIDTRNVRDLAPLLLDGNGEIKVVPASVYADTTPDERAVFCVRHGVYGLPTTELVERLHEIIGDRLAIEIGSGCGVLAKALGIPGTDSMQQARADMQLLYAMSGQRVVTYGANVRKLDAQAAVREYRPQVVIAQWVTHKYDARRPEAKGNMYGVDEEWVKTKVETYVSIGNMVTHAGKSMWKRPHFIQHPPWLYSRAFNGSPNYLAWWGPAADETGDVE